MALRVRFQYPTLSKLGLSIERLSDGLFYDWSTTTFLAAPTLLIQAIPENVAPFLAQYKLTITETHPEVFTDGDYTISVHDVGESSQVVAELGATMKDGDDASYLPPLLAKVTTISINGVSFDVYGLPTPVEPPVVAG